MPEEEYLTLVELLRQRALRQPDQFGYTFLVDGEAEEARLTYAELDQKARAIAAVLQSSHAAGQRALLLYPPGLDYIAAFFGCLYAGVIAVPAYPPRPSRLPRSLPRLRSIINDCQPTLALSLAPMQSVLKSTAARSSDFQALNWLATDEVDAALSEQWQEPSIDERTLAFLQYTSGSTATPKGVMVSHGNLLHNERLIKLAFQQDKNSVVVGWLPLYHDMGLIGNVLQPLYVGAPCILMSPTAFLLSPYQWLRTISKYRATTSGGPNFAYDLCTRKITPQQRESLDLSSWTTAFNGAEPIREQTMERFAAAFQSCGFRREAFAPCYGLAEATLIVSGGLTSLPITQTLQSSSLEQNQVIVASDEEENTQTLVSSGAALLDQKAVIVEPETATLCPPDQVGEIWVFGPSVAQGYWNRPEETASTFHAYLTETGEGPFLRTGDLGFMKNGQLFVTGRLKDLIVIRGRNLYPQDIELTTEKSHAALRPGSGAAFSVEVAGEERLVVVQELAQRQVVNTTEIFDAVRQVISEEYELQAYAIVLLKFGSIPKTSSGKIQRHACRIGFQNGSLEVVAEWRASITAIEDEELLVDDSAPLQSAEAIEQWLALRLAAKLKRDVSEIDVKQPIARYGLDSLLAMELTHNIEAKLGVVLPVVSFLQSLSISQIAAKAVEELLATPSYGPAIATASGDLTVEQPLSYGQRALWFLHQLAPTSSAYNIARAVRIRSRLNIAALRRAFQTLVDRHASLRTTFKVLPGGEPVQEVHQQVEVCFVENDALNWSEEELNERLVAEAHLPFDLENGPLLRISLFQRSTNEHVLLLSLHHIVADFWSLAVLVNELGILYRAENSGVQVTLAPLSLQYSDYASWQAAVLTGAIGEQLKADWEKQLAGELPLLNLPTDYPRPPIQTYNGASQPFTLSPELTEALKAICQSRGTTLFMTLLAAFDVLLHHYTGQDDLVVGSPTAGRSLAETVGVVGYFVNPVALRADLSGNPTFEEFLDRVRQTVIKAFEHQDYPFALLVQQLQPERDPSRSPLFQTMFVFQRAHLLEEEGLASFALGETGARMQLGGLSIESVALPQRIAQFDLTLTVAEIENGLTATLEYNTDLFERESMVRMAEHFENLIASVVKEGGQGQRIGELRLLGEGERQQMLVSWNETERDYQPSDTLLAMFEAQVERAPERVALVDGKRRLSYGEANEQANQLAHYLRAMGVGAEQRVGVLLPRTTELVVGLLGILKAGGAYVPLEAVYPQERLRFMLADAGARVLLTTAGLKEKLGEVSEDELRVVCVDEEAEAIGAMSRENPACETVGTNLAYLIYTSGSTGQPKAVGIEHRSAVTLLQWSLENFTAEELAVVLAGTSISFDLSVFEMFVPLSCGGMVVVAENALALPQLAAGRQVTLINTVPSAMKELLRLQAVPETTLAVNLAGEALSGQLVRDIYEQTTVGMVRNLYGPSEDTTYSTCARLSASDGEPSIGRPIANTQAYVLDQRLEPVAIGVVGELYLGGAGLARGYLGRAELTAEKFVPHPFAREAGARMYRTGDLARYRSDGELEFLGRQDEQVKVRGYRIELGEIESVLRQHERVAAAVVVATSGKSTGAGEGEAGRQLVAYVVGRDGGAAAGELRSYLRRSLPEYMVPGVFVSLEHLPLTSNGKINRRALMAQAEQERAGEASGERVKPRSVTEEILAGLWSAVLGLTEVGVTDNFFERGGHSLLAVQLMSRIRESFAVELELKKLFESPTVAELAELIDQELQAGSQLQLPPIVPVVRDENLPLSFSQERLWFLEQLEPGGAVFNLHAALRLKGALDVAALEQSLNEIIRRHESLRTTFTFGESEPVQLIAPALTIALPLVDVSAHAESEREAEAQRLAAEQGQQPFDLSEAPLLRVLAVRIAAEDHLIVVTMHHAISDGWSMGILLREVSALYTAFSQHKPSPLADLPIQYADYAAWQRKVLEGEWLESHLEYWREQLAGAPPVLDLPADRPRAAVQSFAGATQTMVLDHDLSRQLRRLSQQQGATLFMTLLSAFKVLLSRYTGHRDIVVGTPIANRNRLETEALIGFFINSLTLRTDLSGNPSFTELLRRVYDVTLSAYAHQDVPLEKLIQDLQPERDLSRTPLFQVYFNMLNFPLGDLHLPDLTSELLSFPEAWSKFDLTLYVEDEESIRFNLVYNANLFDQPRMAEMLAQFKHLLAQIVEQPEAQIGSFTLVTPAAEQHLPNPKKQLSAKWEGAVHTLFSRNARRFPNRLAVIDKQGSVTYAELETRSNQLANYLRSKGIQSEDVVAIYAHRSATLVCALLGVFKAGASFLLLDPAYPATRLIHCLTMAKPRGWLQLQSAGVLPQSLKDFVTSQIPCALELPERFDRTADLLASFSTDDPQVAVSADDQAYLAFTSGTSGNPKGIQGRHGPLTHFRPWYKHTFDITESDRFSLLSGLSHDPLHRDVFTPWQFGATICIPDPDMLATPGYLAEWMRQEEITVTNLTPAMGQLLTSELTTRSLLPITSLRYAFFVGDALTTRDVSRVKKLAPLCNIVNLYGSTETQRAVSCFMVNGEAHSDTREEREVLPLGKGIEDVQLLILNEARQLAGVGEVGEISIRSPHLARGYLDDLTLTQERFIPNPFTGSSNDRLYRTGDLGRYRPDGNVASLGRSDFQVKVRGFRVELTEIEAVLGRHNAIKEAVVIASEQASGDRQLVAFVVWRHDLRVTSSQLRRFIKERLPDYMVPAFFIELDEIPLTPNGKLDRQALAKLAQTRPELTTSESRQYTPTEEILAGIWAEVLKVEPIGLHSNFFELGGHSLVVTRVISRVRESFQVEIPLRSLFEKPTVSELAAAIDREKQLHQLSPLPPIRRVPRDSELPLSFAQQRLWFIDQLEPDTAAYNLSAAMWLDGPLDIEALERTLNEIARRHEVLRTNFAISAGRPRQVISSDVKTVLNIVDISDLPEADHAAETQRLVVEQAQRPFDLANDPLWRATLFKLTPQKHAGLLTLHHIVADGWSLEILVREVATLYEAFAQGKSSPLPELEIQYADFGVWQHEWLQGDLLQSHLDYWRQQLSGISVLRLPTDRPRPESGKRGFSGMKYPLELSKELSDALKQFSQREGLTLLMTTLTSFKVLLSYLSGQDDIVVGTDVANRNHAGIEGLIGFFVNQLVLRTKVDQHFSFRELARRVREVALEAYTHQDVPFEKLVETIKPGRNDQLATLFQVKFMLQNERPGVLNLAGLTLSPLTVDNELMDMDLIISLSETPTGLRGWINGDPNLFQATTLARFGTLYATLLQNVVMYPERSVANLIDLLAEVDRHEKSAEKARREENKLERFRAIKPGTVNLSMTVGE